MGSVAPIYRALHAAERALSYHDTFMALWGLDQAWTGMTIFRQQASMYQQLAEKTEDALIKQELLDLAAICEEVANNIEDRRPSG